MKDRQLETERLTEVFKQAILHAPVPSLNPTLIRTVEAQARSCALAVLDEWRTRAEAAESALTEAREQHSRLREAVKGLAEEGAENAFHWIAVEKQLTFLPTGPARAKVQPHWREEAEAMATIAPTRLRAVMAVADAELAGLRAEVFADVAALMNDRAAMWWASDHPGRGPKASECQNLANAFRTYAEGVGVPSLDTLRRKRREAEAERDRLREAVEALADEFDRRQRRNAAHNGNVSCSVWGLAGGEVARILADAAPEPTPNTGERCAFCRGCHPAELDHCLNLPGCPAASSVDDKAGEGK